MTSLKLTLILLWASALHAKEGFSTSLVGAPSAVTSAWDSTFALLTDAPSTYSVGTAFLVWIDRTTPFKKLYFLSVNHVVNSTCEAGKICPSTSLIKNLRLRRYDNNSLGLEPVTELHFDEVMVIDRNANPDMAVLQVTVRQYENEDLKPIPLPANCDLKPGDPLYSIGFPAAHDRTHPASLPIAEKEIETKRWSQGVFVGLFNDEKNGMIKNFIGSSVDSLEGQSGGPILNSTGEAVSISISSASVKGNRFQYSGNEKPGALDWQTLGVRCEILQNMGRELAATSLPK